MGTSGLVKIENEWFIVICSRCRQNLKFGDFTLLFCGVGIKNARKFVIIFPFLTNDILALWRCLVVADVFKIYYGEVDENVSS